PWRTATRPAENAQCPACAHTIHRRTASERGKLHTKHFFSQISIRHIRRSADELRKQRRPGHCAIGGWSPCKAKRKAKPRSGREESNLWRDVRPDSGETSGRRSCGRST